MFQKKIANFLFSTRLMAILFIVFALSMAVSTFIEHFYSTPVAEEWVYDSWWFETIMILFVINFLGNIKSYRLIEKKKWATLLLHLSFVFIIIGAGITRYTGEMGVMPIKEGEVSNTMLTENTYLAIRLVGDHNGKTLQRKQNIPFRLAPGIAAGTTVSTDFKGQEVRFEVVDYMANVQNKFTPTSEGSKYLKIVTTAGTSRNNNFLKMGEIAEYHNILFTLNNPREGAINITTNDQGQYFIKSPFEGTYMKMATQKTGKIAKDSIQPLKFRSLYSVGGLKFVVPSPIIKGIYKKVSKGKKRESLQDQVKIKVSSGGESEVATVMGNRGVINPYKKVKVGGIKVNLRYGSKKIKLPFALRLREFIAKKYPGTADRKNPSYSAFKSKVTLIDDGKEVPKEIYMNHVLIHEGYRFFQSSFMPNEKGTILAVNHDQWGTRVTYTGYFLLFAGLMLIMFVKRSRFSQLKRQLEQVKKKKAKLTTVAVLLSLMSFSTAQAQTGYSAKPTETQTDKASPEIVQKTKTTQNHEHDSLRNPRNWSVKRTIHFIKDNVVSEEHASKFARVVIQDLSGRMKPINTYSSELLRKISGKLKFHGLNNDQAMLSMMELPAAWYNVPIIQIPVKNDSLHKIIDVKEGKEFVALREFFNKKGVYKLGEFLQGAYRAKIKSQFQKDLIATDQKVNLLFNTLDGRTLRLFPVPDSESNNWVTFRDAMKNEAIRQDSMYRASILPMYLRSLKTSRKTGDYSVSNKALQIIKGYQHHYGGEVMPSKEKVTAEILYNKYDVFRGLFWQYMLAGVIMLAFVLLKIFYNKKPIRIGVNIFKVVIIVLFALHTLGLIFRWYISGHAPWTNAYESMIYVAWATMLFGLLFGRKSNLTLSSTAFVTSIILMVAHWNWLDPSIGNLEPVLNSYWLMIHVAVIVASYGPFTLAMILGLLSLFLMLMTNSKNKTKMDLNIREITIITELALTVGLVMLTIGNFLGGIWANESWGRYWGWDPKETWALISIMVYAFVIHMRLVPGLRGRFTFNWVTVFAYSSILMTYFGVNFYLSGLHSYASGEQIISYQFIGASLIIWLVLGYFANRKHKKYFKKPVRKKKK